MWEHCLKGLETDPTSLWPRVRLGGQTPADRALSRARHDVSLSHPKVALIDLQYHDVNRSRGLFYKLQQRDVIDRTCTDEAIDRGA